MEAMSRGAQEAVFVEHSSAVLKCLRTNVQAIGLSSEVRVIKGDALSVLSRLKSDKESFDLVFLDPPYKSEYLKKSIFFLDKNGMLKKGGMIVAENQVKDTIELPSGLRKTCSKVYGNTKVTFIELLKDE